MRLPRPQFRLSTLLWITLAVACWFGGIVVGDRRAKHSIPVFHDELDNDNVVLDEYAAGRMTATEPDEAGNPITVEMSIEGDAREVTMPSGRIVTHWPDERATSIEQPAQPARSSALVRAVSGHPQQRTDQDTTLKPLKHGERRLAIVSGETIPVELIKPLPSDEDAWICRILPGSRMVLVHETSMRGITEEAGDPGGE